MDERISEVERQVKSISSTLEALIKRVDKISDYNINNSMRISDIQHERKERLIKKIERLEKETLQANQELYDIYDMQKK